MSAEQTIVKRRQQGILTGMPFMANIASRTFVDDLGRKLYLAKAPTRLVSLAPSVTEILFALGVGDRLVAVTPFCDYPPEATRIGKIDGARPSVESLIALRPDLILTPRAFIQPALIEKLEQLKIPLFLMDAHTAEDVLSHIHTVGRMVERSDTATNLVSDMRRRIQYVKERTTSLPRPRLLYVLNSRPLITVGPGSFIHQLIELAGAENIASAMGQGYPRISLEDVLRYDPEVLLFPVGTSGGIPSQEQRQWQQWAGMSAVRTHRLYQLESVLLERPGPRLVEGLERLATLLHPDVFSAAPPSAP
jgi:iron complex transport system substrate-binding protein